MWGVDTTLPLGSLRVNISLDSCWTNRHNFLGFRIAQVGVAFFRAHALIIRPIA